MNNSRITTVVGMWEPGFSEYEQIIEWRMWKQTIEAFDVDRWIMAGPVPNGGTFEAVDRIQEGVALLSEDTKRIFLNPFGGVPIEEYTRPIDVAFIFGNASCDPAIQLIRHQDDKVVIRTPKPVDMFAACVLPYVLGCT